MKALIRFFDRSPGKLSRPGPGSAPPVKFDLNGPRDALYAVGDVHGRLDLLKAMESAIANDLPPHDVQKTVILLGDFIDRGPMSAQILDHLLANQAQGFRRICLAGNHERMMLSFLENPSHSSVWLKNGGVATLESYGIGEGQLHEASGKTSRLRALLDSHIPTEHIEFLKSLPFMAVSEHSVFVHAGIDPNVALDSQCEADMTLAVKEFYTTDAMFEKLVIHGHRVVGSATHHGNRVNVDTGAYATGRLSCAKIIDGRVEAFMETTLSGSHLNPISSFSRNESP